MGSIDTSTKQDTVTNATKKRREEDDDDADEENNDLRREDGNERVGDALEEAAKTDDDHMTRVRCWVLADDFCCVVCECVWTSLTTE